MLYRVYVQNWDDDHITTIRSSFIVSAPSADQAAQAMEHYLGGTVSVVQIPQLELDGCIITFEEIL